ncbi:prepilin peptidase [Sulfitobacter sp. LCG007]
MALTAQSALWFLPFVLPICLYVCFTDLAWMRITNRSVMALALVFVLLGPVAMPGWEEYLWRLVQLLVVLVLGAVLNASGALGAGDAKFAAAAAAYVAPGDLRLLLALFAAALLAAFVTHRIAKHSPLRALAPHWESWEQGKKFPMGLALGATLAAYLALGTAYGA